MRRAPQRGSILGLFLAAAGLLVLAFATITALEVQRNRRPTEITLAEFEQQRPKAKWLKLTQCQVNLQGAVYEYSSQDDREVHRVYIPVHPPGEPVPAVVVIDSREHARIVAGALEVQEDEEALDSYLKENEGRFQEVTAFEGWVTSPTEAVASRLDPKEVGAGFVVLEVGRVKTWSDVAGPAALGVLLLAFSVGLMKRR